MNPSWSSLSCVVPFEPVGESTLAFSMMMSPTPPRARCA